MATPSPPSTEIPFEESDHHDYFDSFEDVHEHEPEHLTTNASADDKAAHEHHKKHGVHWPKVSNPFHHGHHKERKAILKEAKALGEELKAKGAGQRRVIVLYNPVSGGGTAKKIVDHMVVPVLKLSGMSYLVTPTKYAGHATEFMKELDCSTVDGVIVSGGDGLVYEVVTGYFNHPDQEAMRKVAIGFAPAGTANAMANHLHQRDTKHSLSLVGVSTLAVCRGTTRELDVFEITNLENSDSKYCLSVFGWGLAGAVAKQAAKMRWIPGQKAVRYDLAGMVTMLASWPVVDKCTLEYPVPGQEEWAKEEVSLVNMVATNLPELGADHPMVDGQRPDNGFCALVFARGDSSRFAVAGLGMAMKKGSYIADQRICRTIFVKEFKLHPHPSKHEHDFLIDGDPMAPAAVHVKVLNRQLTVFAEPEPAGTPKMMPDEAVWIEGKVLLTKPGELATAMDGEDEDMAFHEDVVAGTCTCPSDLSSISEDEPVSPSKKPLQKAYDFIKYPSGKTLRHNKAKQKSFRERQEILRLAEELGKELAAKGELARHITVLYNPVSGRGTAKTLVESMVTPVLQLAGLTFDVIPTEYAGHATELVQELDLSKTDGLMVAGGDGLVHEVVTGYFSHKDQEGIRELAIGIVPGGTANAMAHKLHQHESHTRTNIVGHVALATARGTCRRVDSMKVHLEKRDIYCLSVFGWGLSGAVAQAASKLRWVPGQREARYDIAGFVTMLKDWPVEDKGTMTYKDANGKWVDKPYDAINLTATKMSHLGSDHPICPDVTIDDGRMAVCIMQPASRITTSRSFMQLKKGLYMSEMKGVETILTSEFKIKAKTLKHSFLIDGDAYASGDVHVEVLPKSMLVFAEPAPGVEMIDKGAVLAKRKSSIFTTVHTEHDGTAGGREGSMSSMAIPLETISEETDSIFEAYEEENLSEEHPEEATAHATSKRRFLTHVRWPKKLRIGHSHLLSKHHKERAALLAEAEALGDARVAANAPNRHITVIYNPVSGKGTAKKLCDHIIVPILELCHVEYVLERTQYAGYATEFVEKLDPSTTHGLIVVGGDGLVHEVMNGYFHNPDQEGMQKVSVGICPGGSANAMAHYLHQHESHSRTSIVGHATLATVRGDVRELDVMEIERQGEKNVYCLSVFGWGLSGAVAAQAAKLRWIPGQASSRYDIAGMVTMMKSWPVLDRCNLSYPNEKGEWVSREVSVVNLTATNLAELGADHPMIRGAQPTDGFTALLLTTRDAKRSDVVALGLAMKKGGYLADQKKVTSIWLREFKIEPLPSERQHDFLVDGDPMKPSPIHVRVKAGALKVFAEPPPPAEFIIDIQPGRWVQGIVKVDGENQLPIVYEEDDVLAKAEASGHRRSSLGQILQSKADRQKDKIFEEAKALGAELKAANTPPRRITCIYNPVSGGGTGKKLVMEIVVPILEMTGQLPTVVRTEYAGYAKEYMMGVDPETTDGFLVAGGDGLVHEVITGYFNNPNHAVRKLPIGITPAGTANAMANKLHTKKSHSPTSLVGHATLACVRNDTRKIDVMELVQSSKKGSGKAKASSGDATSGDENKYILSVFGWGLAGVVARQAAKMRWIPGQKAVRYDLAGFVTMLKDWPVIDTAALEYKDEKGQWQKTDIELVNMVATNLAELGADHPMYRGIEPDDGNVAIVLMKPASRMATVSSALAMKRGGYLAEAKTAQAFLTSEFKLKPTGESRSHDFLVDGDPMSSCDIHVKVMHKALTLYAPPTGQPDDDDDDDDIDETDAAVGAESEAPNPGTCPAKPPGEEAGSITSPVVSAEVQAQAQARPFRSSYV